MGNLVESVTNFVHWVFGFVTFVPWLILEHFSPKTATEILNMSRKVKAKRISSEPTSPFRYIDNMDGLMHTAYGDMRTVDRVFEQAANKYPNQPCLGMRPLLAEEDEKQPDGKVFKKAIFGDYEWMKFEEVMASVVDVGRGLSVLGMKPKQKIAIFLETRSEWMISIQACFRHNFPVVTVYATLGEDGIMHALNETEVTHVITSSTLLTTRLQKCAGEIPNLKTVVYVEDVKLPADVTLPDGVEMISFSKVEELGQKNADVTRESPQPDDLAVIMYTSGQSGQPKGVLINHSNFVAGISGIQTRIPDLGTSDVYIGYLPLAHVLELAAENLILCAGARIGYSSPLTLSDRSSRIKKGSRGDAPVLRPTLMAAVPEIMERMRKTVMQGIDEKGAGMKKIFNMAYNYKLKQIERGHDTPLFNKLLFKKTRALLGGRVRAMLSGGAPMDAQTQRFMNVCMCCPVGQGYGLTETCGATSVSEVEDDFTTGRTGPPLPCCEVKLVAWEEGGYSPSNEPHPQGEIHIGGPNITQGYFKKPDKTAEDFYVDDAGQRWFKTGDIGQIDADGAMRIIDRKKDLVKLSHGEYLALGNIEAKIKTSAWIDNVWVYANSAQPYCLAFLVPNEKTLRQFCEKQGLGEAGDSVEALCKNPAVVKEMKTAVAQIAKTTKLQKFEIPQKLHIEPEPWLPEHNLITAAFKLKRKALEAKYQADIEQLYAAK